MRFYRRFEKPGRPVDLIVSLVWLLVGATLVALMIGARGAEWLTITLGTIAVWGIYEGAHALLRRQARARLTA